MGAVCTYEMQTILSMSEDSKLSVSAERNEPMRWNAYGRGEVYGYTMPMRLLSHGRDVRELRMILN